MKRLLLSCALIGATFACNAMTPEQKYVETIKLSERGELTVKKVNEYLLKNDYVMSHKQEVFAQVLLVQGVLMHNLPGFLNVIDSKRPMTEEKKKTAHHLLGVFRILEIAHEFGEGVEGYEQLDMDALIEPKAKIEAYIGPVIEEEGTTSFLSSASSAVFSKRGGIALVAIVAAYFGYSYWNNSKKAQQSN